MPRMNPRGMLLLVFALIGLGAPAIAATAPATPLRLAHERTFLILTGGTLPGPVTIHYIEGYCRPGRRKKAS